MGGAGYIFTGEHDTDIMLNSSQINILAVQFALRWKAKVFYSSSACMYPAYNQEDPSNPNCKEGSAYPANPDSEYGWAAVFSYNTNSKFAKMFGWSRKDDYPWGMYSWELK